MNAQTIARPHAAAPPRLSNLEIGLWLRAVAGDEHARERCEARGIAIERAQGMTSNSAGGFLAPDGVEQEIHDVRAEYSIPRQYARVRIMSAGSTSVPRRAGGVSAQFTGEGAEIAESTGQWDAVGFTARKATVLSRASAELADDAVADLGEVFATDVGQAFAALENACMFAADGTAAYGGMTGIGPALVDGSHAAGIATATGHSTLATFDAADLGAVAALLPEAYWPRACWFASGYAVGAVFARLGASGAGMTMTAAGPRPVLQYMGLPVVPVPGLPGAGTVTGRMCIALGDLARAASIGVRREIRVAVSLSRYMDLDQVGFRATSRFHCVAHDLGDGTTAGPIVGLVAG